jgi:dTDP-D-glucose 4,6-dehydratase
MLNVARAENEIGFRARTILDEGLKKTIQWYLERVWIWIIQRESTENLHLGF